MNTTSRTLSQLALGVCALAFVAPAQQALAAPGWGGERVQGSGNVTRQVRQVEHFSGLALAVPGNLELRIGNSEGVTIETDDNLQPLIETVVDGGMLKIQPARRNLNIHTRNLKIVVQARSIDRIALAGSGSVEADALRAPKLKFDLGGSGSIKVKSVETDSVAATIGGSGDLNVGGGSARQVSLTIGGSGNVDLGRVKADSASVKVAGSGEATVWAASALSMTIAGSGDVNYYGDPAISKSVLGSGGARRLGAAPR
ncbi:MAG: head GIN domain-containing protein [Massilia sp.]